MHFGRRAPSGAASPYFFTKVRPGSPRSLRQRAAFPLSLVAMVSACGLGASACSSDDSSGAGGAAGTGGTVDSGTGGTSSGGSAGTGGTATGGAAGSGGARPDAAPEAAPGDAASDVVLPCIIDGGDASGDCCPDDPLKTQPGICGCGISDTVDTDLDGTPDCIDECAGDPLKIHPGICGCNVSDTLDTDNDGTPDCIDLCPKDHDRIVPGTCGCGAADNTPLCLVHRYMFDDGSSIDGGTVGTDAGDAGRSDAGDAGRSDAEAGVGEGGTVDAGGGGATTVVSDSIGHADGTAHNVVLTGARSVTLAGLLSDQYISLPSGIISALGDNATFEFWVTWPGTGGSWQRFFDFGRSDMADGVQGTGQEWIFLTPLSGTNSTLLLSSNIPGGGLNEASSPTLAPSTAMRHMAVVVQGPSGDGGAGTLTVYVDGLPVSMSAMSSRLTQLHDVNNWLGRSQFVADPELTGTYHEFRIYSRARTAPEIQQDAMLGPDVLPQQ